jgi:hypothetical protein
MFFQQCDFCQSECLAYSLIIAAKLLGLLKVSIAYFLDVKIKHELYLEHVRDLKFPILRRKHIFCKEK